MLVAIMAMLCCLRGEPDECPPSPPAAPLDFKLVQERYPRVQWFIDGRLEVESLLGPPTEREISGPEVQEWETRAARRCVGLPFPRVWDKWTVLNDERKWIVVLYASDKVHCVIASTALRDAPLPEPHEHEPPAPLGIRLTCSDEMKATA